MSYNYNIEKSIVDTGLPTTYRSLDPNSPLNQQLTEADVLAAKSAMLKLLNEVQIRFDNDPKFLTKRDFGKLIELLQSSFGWLYSVPQFKQIIDDWEDLIKNDSTVEDKEIQLPSAQLVYESIKEMGSYIDLYVNNIHANTNEVNEWYNMFVSSDKLPYWDGEHNTRFTFNGNPKLVEVETDKYGILLTDADDSITWYQLGNFAWEYNIEVLDNGLHLSDSKITIDGVSYTAKDGVVKVELNPGQHTVRCGEYECIVTKIWSNATNYEIYVQDPLILYRDPELDMEAATKQYVDNCVSNYSPEAGRNIQIDKNQGEDGKDYIHALGYKWDKYRQSFAIGEQGSNGNVASGNYSFAEGYFTYAGGQGASSQGYNTSAQGQYSHAEGYRSITGGTKDYNDLQEGPDTNTSNGAYAHAEGNATIARGNSSHSEGKMTFADGIGAHAEGAFTRAVGTAAHAEGLETQASASRSHAEGMYTEASAQGAHAEGESTTASGQGSHAEGKSTTASGNYSHASGESTTASGKSAFTTGYANIASGEYSFAGGKSSTASNKQSFAFGNQVESSKSYSAAFGSKTVSSGESSFATGIEAQATNKASFTQGNKTIASGKQAAAFGNQSEASGESSFAGGVESTASGKASFAFGKETYAYSNYAAAFGQESSAGHDAAFATGMGTTAAGKASFTAGNKTNANANYSFAAGNETHANGEYSATFGDETSANSKGSFAQGKDSVADASYSHAEGMNSTTYGEGAHAEGKGSIANGNYSHAEGRSTVTYGEASHAEGNSTTANGSYSHAEGKGTTASGDYSKTIGVSSETASTESSLVIFSYGGSWSGYNENSLEERVYHDGYWYLNGNTWTSNNHADNSTSNAIIAFPEGREFTLTMWCQGEPNYDYLEYTDINSDSFIYALRLSNGTSATITIPPTAGRKVVKVRYRKDSSQTNSPDQGYFTITEKRNYGQLATGLETQAVGTAASSFGINTKAAGNASMTQGVLTLAVGFASHAEGGNTEAPHDGYAWAPAKLLRVQCCAWKDYAINNGLYYEPNGLRGITLFVYDKPTLNAIKSGTKVRIGGAEFTISSIASDLRDPAGSTSYGYSYSYSYSGSYSAPSSCYYALENIAFLETTSISMDRVFDAEVLVPATSSTLGVYGNYSHGEGLNYYIDSTSKASHAEGEETQILGATGAHAEGYKTSVQADYAHAEGIETQALAVGSSTSGYGTVASDSYQAVVGKFNTPDEAAFIVGCGENDSTRANAFVVHWDGRVSAGADPVEDMDLVTKGCLNDVILENEQITAAALNDLNDRLLDVINEEYINSLFV